jgi:hypothetical protein
MTSAFNPPAYATRLREVLDLAGPHLLMLVEAGTAQRPAAGRWSPREIVGHLIDSASNNHQRFVRATMQDDLVFAGYAQEQWVTVQDYASVSWESLVTLFLAFNRHLAHVMSVVPATIRDRVVAQHNFDRIAYRTVPATTPTTLAYFMADYVAHLEHHLGQILGADWERRAHGHPGIARFAPDVS